MSTANYPNGFAEGVTIRGVPLTVAHPGEVFWVNSTSVLPKRGVGGQAGGPGTYKQPFATIAQALDACTASRGDIIMVMPGYTQTIAAAAGDLYDVAGVAIIGLGTGSLKPSMTLTATASDIDVSAANMTIYNLRFIAGVADVVHCLQVTGANFTIDNCDFVSSSAAFSLLTSVITTATATGFQITNSTINMETTTTGVAVTDVAAAGVQTLADNSVISNNRILGEFSIAAIYNVTTAALSLVISDNDIYNGSTAAAAGVISLAAGCNGMIFRNMALALETSAITGLVINGGCGMSENYAVNVITETAGLIHAAST